MAGNKPKTQHWVPRFYLRSFATADTRDAKRPQTWICSNRDEDDAPTVVGIDNVAAENFLYSPQAPDGTRDFSVEEQLSKLEGLLSLRWDHVANSFVDLTAEPLLKQVLAAFIGTLMFRHPRVYKQTIEHHRKMLAIYDSWPKDELGCPRPAILEVDGQEYEVDGSDWHDYKRLTPEELRRDFAENIHPGSVEMMPDLLKKRWSIIVADNPVFVTSDRPVVLRHPSRQNFGTRTPGTIITFPLSPTRMLMLDDHHEVPTDQYYPLRGGADFFNLLSLWNTHRFVISHDEPLAILRKAVDWGQQEIEKAARRSSPPFHGKIGRNSECPCGSGKKFKKCCGAVGSS